MAAVTMSIVRQGPRATLTFALAAVAMVTSQTCREGKQTGSLPGLLESRLPSPVLAGSGSRVCGCPHSQRLSALPCRMWQVYPEPVTDDPRLVHLDIDGYVATITLDSPQNRNALSRRLV